MNYCIVLVIYGEENFDRIEKFFREIPMRLRCRIALVQNKAGCRFPLIENAIFHHGTNALREFSGYEEGINALNDERLLDCDDVLVLLNDTVFKSFSLISTVLKNGMLCVEKVNCNRRTVILPVVIEVGRFQFLERTLKKIFATYFVVIKVGFLRELGGMTPCINFDSFLARKFQKQLFINPSTADYNRFYNEWLGCGSESGIGRWWASQSFCYSEENFNFLREKAKMILLETHFSYRIVESRCDVIDLYGRGVLLQAMWTVKIRLLRFIRS